MAVTGGFGEVGAERIGVPLGFAVPEGWAPVDPASVGAPGAAFVAVRTGVPEGAGFTPNITVGVDRRDDAPDVDEVADEAIGRLAAAVAELTVAERDRLGDQLAPCVAQVLRVRTTGRPALTLVQSQVHLVLALGDSPADRIVVELVCTCTPPQVPAVTGDFQQLVGSFHIREDDAASGGGADGAAR